MVVSFLPGFQVNLMKQVLAVILLLFTVMTASATSVTRLVNETAESFAKRNGPAQMTLLQQAIESSEWNGKGKAIIAFYEHTVEEPSAGQTYRHIVSYLFLPESDQSYQKILIDTFESEGGDPVIEAVFFANFGKSKPTKKLIIICSWLQLHYDFYGKLYATFVYDVPRPGTTITQLKFEEDISKRLEGGCECEWRDGTRSHAKYKTADEVKAELQKMTPFR